MRSLSTLTLQASVSWLSAAPPSHSRIMFSWFDTLDRQAISDLSGSFSFVIWLFAQSPQLYENYRRGSVEGLSPVFLTQWMLGDATNLIGSLLTQQLPFQIAVATYFCCVDVCIMVQFVYYWRKASKERAQRSINRSRQHSGSLSSPYPPNPYSVLSEASELLAGRTSRHNSFLRSSSKRRVNLSHSQHLVHPHRYATQYSQPHNDPHAPLISHSDTNTPAHAPHSDRRPAHARYESSRSRSRHPPSLSRNSSTDNVSGVAAGSVANYRALSDAALSVAQLAQEAARRREAMLHPVHTADQDYFSHGRTYSHRSKSRTSCSPNHSQPPSRTRSRVNSNEVARPDELSTDLASGTHSAKVVRDAPSSASASRKSRIARSMSSRRNPMVTNVDFVPSALSPTRESKDVDEATSALRSTSRAEHQESEAESVSEAESGSRDETDETGSAANLTDSVDSLASISTKSRRASAEPRGRDMVRTATRIDTAPASGAATPAVADGVRRDRTLSPFSAHSSSDGTARHASPHPVSREASNTMSQSHGVLERHDRFVQAATCSNQVEDTNALQDASGARNTPSHNSTRDSSPAASMYRSVDTLAKRDASGKRAIVRSMSSRSHSKRAATGGGAGRASAGASASASGNKRSGTKSPASMRRSIGMVLLGIIMVSSFPSTSMSAVVSGVAVTGDVKRSSLFDADGASWRRLVGRISAWLCALLYITSRIPQIWENHIRRSVAGISILLFIAAFSGNLLYTISVLTNPSANGDAARTYLQESLPFLLGSGGTLVFDLMIVAQWAAWRNKV